MNRLANIVKGLLDFSKLRTNTIELEYFKFDIGELFKEQIETHEGQFESLNMKVHLDIEENLRGEWDPQRVIQIVNNLISNILKFAPGGDVYFPLRVVEILLN